MPVTVSAADPGVLPGVEYRRDATSLLPQYILGEDVLPPYFPTDRWTDQSNRYSTYWSHFKGDTLNEIVGTTDQGEPIYKFPLRINTARNLARIHASLLFGEIRDASSTLVRPVFQARSPLSGDKPAEADKRLARVCEAVANEIWEGSNGGALQMENGILSQFLGGSVLQAMWQPFRRDLVIPIAIRSVPADFFLPVAWATHNPYELLECYVIYRIGAAEAEQLYQVDSSMTGDYLTYAEHWKRDRYSIYLDGKPLTEKWGDVTMTYDNLTNPFGFIPIMYIPHLREGDFFGSSHIPDMIGLIEELNGRQADVGEAIRDTVHPERYMTDVVGSTQNVQLANGQWATDLGSTNPSTKTQPKVWRENPAPMPTDVQTFNKNIWNEINRQGFASPMVYGEDEGSQRSGETLGVRFWPSKAHAQMERTFWTPGLNAFNQMLISMVQLKQERLSRLGISIPEDWRWRVRVSQNWNPVIPRDRTAEVNENILMKQAYLKPPEEAIRDLGDSLDVDETWKKIQEYMKFEVQLRAAAAPTPGQPTGTPQRVTVPAAAG